MAAGWSGGQVQENENVDLRQPLQCRFLDRRRAVRQHPVHFRGGWPGPGHL